MGAQVEVVRDTTDEVVTAIGRLLPQLSRTAAPIDPDGLPQLLSWHGTTLLVARVDGAIVGMLNLVIFPVPSGLRARIEDVAVDASARGHGVGAALAREAARLAGEAGARTVDLTSRPSREAANRLYERLGFELRDSRVYRLVLGEQPTTGSASRA